MSDVAFFGTGKMGEPMAINFLARGHRILIKPHRHREPIERLVAKGAWEVPTPADAARQSAVAVLIVPTAAEVEEVIFGPAGLAEGMRPGYIIVDMSTGYPPDSRRIASRVQERGGQYLDAPVTGGPGRAEDATLTIMVGGDAGTLAAVRPILEAVGRNIFHFGPTGAGHTAKLVQNMIGIVASAGIAEALVLAKVAGLDVSQVFQMLSSSMANSPLLQRMVPKVLARDFDTVSARLDILYKDIRQATALARELAVPLLVANGTVELMQVARAAGFGAQDGAALIRGLERIAGVEVRGEVRDLT